VFAIGIIVAKPGKCTYDGPVVEHQVVLFIIVSDWMFCCATEIVLGTLKSLNTEYGEEKEGEKQEEYHSNQTTC
jgi:uncharacterized protein YegJ (DUF2314 family)